MIQILMVLALATGAALGQEAPTKERTAEASGSIAGAVVNSETGAPLAGIPVFVRVSGKSVTGTTDSRGNFTLQAIPPGTYMLAAGVPGQFASKQVTVASGQSLSGIRLPLEVPGYISGKVTDGDGHPVSGALVALVQREYHQGQPGFSLQSSATTDDLGRYELPRVSPGRPFQIMARPKPAEMPAVSGVPQDPARRPAVFAPAYYPNSDSWEAAQSVTVHSAEHREAIDIRMPASPSYCADGVAEGYGQSGDWTFRLLEEQPSNGGFAGPRIRPAAGGKFRLCGLHRGEYRIEVLQNGPAGGRFGAVAFTVSDRDVHGLSVAAQSGVPLSGEVVWQGDAPKDPAGVGFRIVLQHASHPGAQSSMNEALETESALPGRFHFDNLQVDRYVVTVTPWPTRQGSSAAQPVYAPVSLSSGWYVKDITYGTASVLRDPLNLGAAMAGTGLRVVVARDGGTVSVRATDPDGRPVAGASVWVFPTSTESPARLATELTAGETDSEGNYLSGTLAPGRYSVLISPAKLDQGADSIDRLWRARNRAREVTVGPNAAASVALSPVELDCR